MMSFLCDHDINPEDASKRYQMFLSTTLAQRIALCCALIYQLETKHGTGSVCFNASND